MNEINKELIKYIEKIIDEHYSLNDKGHDKNHVEYVINRSLKFANQINNINLNMVYVIAAYHDVAHHIDAKKHEELSAEMLLNDANLKKYFNDEEIKIMSEAVADHRSSLEGEPRTIYGKIVSSADRNTNVNVTLRRCYSYNKKHSPELSEEELIEKCRKFLLEKFGVNGYARDKMYFNDEDYTNYLNDITELASNIEQFKKEIKKVNIANWNEYYNKTMNSIARQNVIDFINKHSNLNGQAVDLGCGAGNDTVYLLKNNWNVLAIDSNNSEKIIRDRLNEEENRRLEFKIQKFEDLVLINCDLLISNFSIPFCDKNKFNEMWNRICKSISQDGYFVGNLFGKNDEWNTPNDKRTFLTKDEALELLKNFEIIEFSEKEYDKKLASGKIKHWHIFEIVAQKK